MIPYELDPSLHAAPPAPERLDDGFAPPPPDPLPGATPATHDRAPPEERAVPLGAGPCSSSY